MLLERENELEAAGAALGRCAEGEGGVVAFVGPAGIGKSELLSGLVRAATDEGMTVLAARGTELERDFAFGIARQLFETEIANASEQERGEIFDGAARLAAPMLDPLAAGEAAPTLDPTFASLHGLYWLTANLAARNPMLLAVDDVHWADLASLRWLVHLAGRLEGVPALLAVAIREPEPGVDEPLIEELQAAPGTLILRPAPLTHAALAGVIAERLGKAPELAFTEACHASTAGNPFLAQELLAALEMEGLEPTAANAASIGDLGPTRVARSVLARIGRLPDDCRELAVALAVVGDGTTLAIAAELARLSREEAAAAADELALAGVLRQTEQLGFAHPIVAAAVRSDLPPRQREALHREAARIL